MFLDSAFRRTSLGHLSRRAANVAVGLFLMECADVMTANGYPPARRIDRYRVTVVNGNRTATLVSS